MGSKRKQGRSLNKVVWPTTVWPTQPRHIRKIGRNEPCPCGGGKKYKDCHEKDGETFLAKLADREAKAQRRALREEQKAAGVPWYRRLFGRP